jgi:pimeloyl-ACP methyl ester carboxylesterase
MGGMMRDDLFTHLVNFAEALPRAYNRLRGVDRYGDPSSYFGAGGLEEAEALCAAANRDLLEWITPPDGVAAVGAERLQHAAAGEWVIDGWSFDSPLPSGSAVNDRVQLRIWRHVQDREPERCVLLHHPVYQRNWSFWPWFFAPLIRQMPLVMMAAPHHLSRAEPGRFPGEGTVNANPARLFEAVRQWCWDHEALSRLLVKRAGLLPAGVVAISFGAFQTLLLASAGRLDLPLVTLASTNRYAWGVTRGALAHGLRRSLSGAGIDAERLSRMTRSLQLEDHVGNLRGRPILYIRGLYDRVDPPPSLERLERSLRPACTLLLPAGHGTLFCHRGKILQSIADFFAESGVWPDRVGFGSAAADTRSG